MSYLVQAQNIKAALAELLASRQADTTKMMYDELALIKARVINDGKKADDSQREGYTPAYLLKRVKAGRPVAFKTFSFRGFMWKHVVPVVIANDAVSTTYVFGSDDEEGQRLINYQKAQAGDFLATSESEYQLLAQLNRQRVFNILRKHQIV